MIIDHFILIIVYAYHNFGRLDSLQPIYQNVVILNIFLADLLANLPVFLCQNILVSDPPKISTSTSLCYMVAGKVNLM